jgi:signal transduction histidine kinase/AraC-like DNA-binding protein
MKNYSILIAVLFVFFQYLFSSCMGKEDSGKKYIIGFSQCTSDPWREAVLLEMQIEISNYKNAELVVFNAMDNNNLQISQIRRLILQNVDVLIISPNETVPITDVAVEAYKKGIPTIIHDRKIQSDEFTVSIGANNYNIGSVIGEYINDILPAQATILEIWGLEGSSPAIERHGGFMHSLRPEREYNIRELFGKWHYNIALEEVNKLESFDDIDLVYAHNDIMALAARDLIMQKDPKSGERIKFLGIDGVYGDGAGLEAVADGRLEASFQYPTGGAVAIQVAMAIASGEPVKKNYTLNTSIIDQSNAKTILAQSEQVYQYQRRINRQKQVEDNLLSRFRFLRSSTLLILALMIIIIPLLGYVMYMNLKIKNKNLLVESQKEELSVKNHQIENISNQKLQFFTNISHEIRTPITLIVGPTNKLIKNEKLDPEVKEDIALIKRNVDRLYRIVNQILDFRRIDNDKMKLVLRQVDMIQLAMEVYNYFAGIAEEKQIRYEFKSDLDKLLMYVDVNKIEQVLVNILSNAFKYSNKRGMVRIFIKDDTDSVLIIIEDKGKGLSKEDLEHLFERFYTGDKKLGMMGFGIGLNLSKEYIDLHDGEIHAESQPGEYSKFTIRLYKDVGHYTGEYILEEKAFTTMNGQKVEVGTAIVDQVLAQSYPFRLLVAEDDSDVRSYLHKELSANFDVVTVDNGSEVLSLLEKQHDFSLIISDVLMPEMNGFQLTTKIKSNIQYSHLPVILLTALSEDSQRIYGIAEGADEYIQKPFNIDFLKVRIINILQERQRMKEAFMKQLESGFVDNAEINKIVHVDDIFRNKLLNTIESVYGNSDFNIEDLSDKIGLSRVQLYRKTKALFDISPTEFLRNYRLNKAILMLRQQQYNVSEIAYMTGFTSPAYFTKCFKLLYKLTPSDYLASLQNKNGVEEKTITDVSF